MRTVSDPDPPRRLEAIRSGEPPLTCAAAAAALRAGIVSSTELVKAAIARADALDPELGVYLARFDDQALAQAERSDSDFSEGIDRGPLQGIPIGIKDNLAAAEGPTTAQSLIPDPAWLEGRDSVVVERLRAGGAVITGKVTLMEYACGLPDPQKPFPVSRNPWDPNRWSGGSSTGSAAGVAAGLFPVSIGTDTGGSIRGPAAYCGVSGLMPTFGRVPTAGLIPLGFSLDRVGPIARSARDCGMVLEVIGGPDSRDPFSAVVSDPPPLSAFDGSLSGVRVGVDRGHHFGPRDDPEARPLFEAAVEVFTSLGASVTEVSLPHFAEAAAASMLTAYCDGFAYHHDRLRSEWNRYSPATRKLLGLGALFSGADYVQAQRVRRAAQRALGDLFREVDVVACPTSTAVAPTHEQMQEGGVNFAEIMRSMHTPYWNGVGVPVLAAPIGFNDEGIPLGFQLAGRPFEEALLLRVGEAYQIITDWHERIPGSLTGLVASDGAGRG